MADYLVEFNFQPRTDHHVTNIDLPGGHDFYLLPEGQSAALPTWVSSLDCVCHPYLLSTAVEISDAPQVLPWCEAPGTDILGIK